VDRENIVTLAKILGVLIIIFIMQAFGISGWVQNLFSWYSGPVSQWSFQLVESVQDSTTSIFGGQETLDQYNELKIEYAILQGKYLSFSDLEEENKALKEQLRFTEENRSLQEAEILSSGVYTSNDSIIINAGSDSEIKEEDIVVLGESYVGTVASVSEKTSLVQLPTNFKTYLKVRIDHGEKSYEGVAIGTLSGIKVENIVNNAEIEAGDVVFIVDEKVGDVLVLGTVSEVFGQPNDPNKSVLVNPAINYLDLKYVFVIL